MNIIKFKKGVKQEYENDENWEGKKAKILKITNDGDHVLLMLSGKYAGHHVRLHDGRLITSVSEFVLVGFSSCPFCEKPDGRAQIDTTYNVDRTKVRYSCTSCLNEWELRIDQT